MTPPLWAASFNCSPPEGHCHSPDMTWPQQCRWWQGRSSHCMALAWPYLAIVGRWSRLEAFLSACSIWVSPLRLESSLEPMYLVLVVTGKSFPPRYRGAVTNCVKVCANSSVNQWTGKRDCNVFLRFMNIACVTQNMHGFIDHSLLGIVCTWTSALSTLRYLPYFTLHGCWNALN